jgi:hypothetical protein
MLDFIIHFLMTLESTAVLSRTSVRGRKKKGKNYYDDEKERVKRRWNKVLTRKN